MQRGRNRLELQARAASVVREFAQRVVLAAGHDERHLGHRAIVSAPRRGIAAASLPPWRATSQATKDGISERVRAGPGQARLIEVEHLSRYRWAAQIANGRKVLDAGCGTAYGSRLLAEGGAREVMGVDIAQCGARCRHADMPAQVSLQAGDLRKLEFEDDTFELIVCFEVIEYVDDPLAVLDELVRVLAPGGLLLVSSPNRGVYQPGNPHHLHEFAPAELEAELVARLATCGCFRQHDYVVSALRGPTPSTRGDGGGDLGSRGPEAGRRHPGNRDLHDRDGERPRLFPDCAGSRL